MEWNFLVERSGPSMAPVTRSVCSLSLHEGGGQWRWTDGGEDLGIEDGRAGDYLRPTGSVWRFEASDLEEKEEGSSALEVRA